MFLKFYNNEKVIKQLAEQLKDFKIKGIPIKYDNARINIMNWLGNFTQLGFPDSKLPLKLLESLEFIKTEALSQKIAELVEPLMNELNSYIAPLGESSESSYRITSNFNQYENYFPNISALLNNIPNNINPTIILIDDFLNSGGQLINIFYALLGQELPNGEPNDEIEYRTLLNEKQIAKLKQTRIILIYYLAFDEGIDNIINRCKIELQLDITVKRYLATNKNQSAFGDPSEQELISKNLRGNVSSMSSAFTNFRTETLSSFYNLLMKVGIELNKVNKPNWDNEKVKNRALGYSNLGRIIITDYNIPTISITCLWQSGEITINGKNIYWHSLLPRREKKLGPSNAEVLGESLISILEDVNESEVDDTDLKGYNEIYKILKLFRPHAKFDEIVRQEIKKNKIGYIIFREIDSVHNRVSFYIYLFEGMQLSTTYDDIKMTFPDITRLEKGLIILLPKEKKQVHIEKRIERIKKKFNPLSIFYIDDFIRENCTPLEYFKKGASKFLDNKNFIKPTIKTEFYNEIDLETIQSWILSDNEPILVVKGVGGVGKTTLTEYISDLFINKKSHSKVIFIDTHELIEELLRREKYNEDIDLYYIYEADIEVNRNSQFKLSKDQFKLNLDIGNILVVIDGLDEVISRIAKFDVDKFLDSIFKFTNETGNGKVLISCRSHFWQTSKYSSNQIISIEILPFDLPQAKLFFEKCFTKDNVKVRKAFNIANHLLVTDESKEMYYHPYVLDIIKNLINTEKEIQESAYSIESKLLEKTVKYDLIIYEVCFRESNRIIKGLGIDHQVKFFLELAVDHKGQIEESRFASLVQESLKIHVDKTNVEAFKSHPFLMLNNGVIKFRYDFLTQYFKSIYISNYIKYEGEYKLVDADFINILVEDCWYNSGTINDMKLRIKSWTDDDDLKIIDLITQLTLNKELEKNVTRKAISHLFYIDLAIHHRNGLNDINSNTNLLRLLFGGANKTIEGLCLINFYSKKENIRFDFRGLIFNDCYIDDFESFWICPADHTTIFKNCTLINLNFSELIKSNIPRVNFRDCIFNEEVDDFYRQKLILKGDNLNLQIRYELQHFFKLFLTRGKLERQPYENYIIPQLKNYKGSVFNIEEFIDLLIKKNVIKLFDEFGEMQIKITDNFKDDVKSLIRNGMISSKLGDLVMSLKKLANVELSNIS